MKFTIAADHVFLRLDPNDELITSLKTVACDLQSRAIAIVSGVGMISTVTLGFFDHFSDSYKSLTHDGIHDVSGVSGNITWRGQEPIPHVHIILNDRANKCVAGHVINAVCHVTIEIFLSITSLQVERIKRHDRPATLIATPNEFSD
jgi:uncharacterized protein